MTLMALFQRVFMVLCPEKCSEILKFSCPGKNFYCAQVCRKSCQMSFASLSCVNASAVFFCTVLPSALFCFLFDVADSILVYLNVQ